MKTLFVLSLLFQTITAFADSNYYPQSSLKIITNPNTPSEKIRQELFNLTSKVHIKNPGKSDTLAEVCPSERTCQTQRLDISYEEARKIMFGDLFLVVKGRNKYALTDVYCNKVIDQTQGVGPDKIPNATVVNCEHTWPQSKFTDKFPLSVQKTDLHHLFPVDMKANSTRNNHPFAEVDGKPTNSTCTDSYIGTSQSEPDLVSFEPPKEHKGNVARAMFYFSIRYKMPISASEAEYLRKWNAEDPVDEAESLRNDKIMNIQGNRNPFVDYPEIIDQL
jgi:deoxyribonuclease I